MTAIEIFLQYQSQLDDFILEELKKPEVKLRKIDKWMKHLRFCNHWLKQKKTENPSYSELQFFFAELILFKTCFMVFFPINIRLPSLRRDYFPSTSK